MSDSDRDQIIILDFGSQLTQLIARRLREMGVFSVLLPYSTSIEKIKSFNPKGIILSGGPSSVLDEDSPTRDVSELLQTAPLLGICYGMQLICHQLGGKVSKADMREYGQNTIRWDEALLEGVNEQSVWMSHGDYIEQAPVGFSVRAKSQSNHIAVVSSDNILCFQFHPEVNHTEKGEELLKHFCFEMCKAKPNWTAEGIVDDLKNKIKQQVPDGANILCGLSGGVDSTVVGHLLTSVLGKERVKCVFVNNGLLRKNEFEKVQELYKELDLNVTAVDASKDFLSELQGVSDPETKRKIIGRVFIDVFKKSIKSIGKVDYLAQGTLYPDVIESVSPRGESVTIKSHHNVGGLPDDLNLELVEPLRELFKDEVRRIGEHLGIPKKFLWRHPFPGPGLAIRLIGEINAADLDTLRESDDIYINELKNNDLYDEIWQAFCVLLPVRTVGVQGDARSYEKVLAIRAVTSKDGMTADWYDFDGKFMRKLSNRITNEVKGVNRVVYDVTSKPPGTIEWE